MNKAILIGRLVRDPEVKFSQSENSTAVARWTLAVDRKFKRAGDTQEADFIGCIAFGKTAEFVEKYFTKGMKMVVEGHIQTESYTNKDGVKIYTTDIAVEQVEFAESKRDDGGHSTRPEPSSAVGDGFMNIPSGACDELPFN